MHATTLTVHKRAFMFFIYIFSYCYMEQLRNKMMLIVFHVISAMMLTGSLVDLKQTLASAGLFLRFIFNS